MWQLISEGSGNPLQYCFLRNPWTEELVACNPWDQKRVWHDWACTLPCTPSQLYCFGASPPVLPHQCHSSCFWSLHLLHFRNEFNLFQVWFSCNNNTMVYLFYLFFLVLNTVQYLLYTFMAKFRLHRTWYLTSVNIHSTGRVETIIFK